MEKECGTCSFFIEDEDGERSLLNISPAAACDPACVDYEAA